MEPRGIEPHRSPCEGLPPPWVMRPRCNSPGKRAVAARRILREADSGDGGSRTPGLLGATETLSQLSYIPNKAVAAGLEPAERLRTGLTARPATITVYTTIAPDLRR